MQFNEYQQHAMSTMAPLPEQLILSKHEVALIIAMLGIAGEGGEAVDHVKKWLAQGHPLDINLLEKEVGDLMWYVALAADALDINLNDVAVRNIEKLQARYPRGFNTHGSIFREKDE